LIEAAGDVDTNEIGTAMRLGQQPLVPLADSVQPPYTRLWEVTAVVTKTERIEIRADSDSQARIAEAAHLLGASMSAFILAAARTEADRVLARADRTLMAPDQFDAMIISLDEPDTARALAQAAARPRRYTRS
jgi:uncharacterized protein (DUF1778 family)